MVILGKGVEDDQQDWMESQRALDNSVVMRRLTWEDVHPYD
jgi:hypothetical protein